MEYINLGRTGLKVSRICLGGASKMSHLEEAVAALEIKLSPEESRFLEEPYQPHPVLGHS